MRKLAFAAIPGPNGTYTIYQTLRAQLSKYSDWDILCVTLGKAEHSFVQPEFIDSGCVSILPFETNHQKLVKGFLNWCIKEAISVLIPTNSRIIVDCLEQLPKFTKIISRCTHITDDGYVRATTSIHIVDKLIAISPRQVKDLVDIYNVPLDLITLIPNGVDVSLLKVMVDKRNFDHKTLRLGYLGRLENLHKGVMYMPAILTRLDSANINYQLNIAGNGELENNLKTAFKYKNNSDEKKVVFHGVVARDKIPFFFRNIDILLFPSNSDAFGISVVEGMASGCVPIASKIDDVTDFIIQDRITGMLCNVGDVDAFADAVVDLNKDRMSLKKMSESASKRAEILFDDRDMVLKYIQVLNSVI